MQLCGAGRLSGGEDRVGNGQLSSTSGKLKGIDRDSNTQWRTLRLQSRGVKNVILNGRQAERQLVGLPWAADSCPWVGKLRTVLPLTNRDVIRDSAVQLGLTLRLSGGIRG
jgi:hypothetical protein